MTVPPDGGKCRKNIKLRGTATAPSDPGVTTITLGPPLQPKLVKGTTPPSCLHEFYLEDLAPGKWTVTLSVDSKETITCRTTLVRGPLFNFTSMIIEHENCGSRIGEDRE